MFPDLDDLLGMGSVAAPAEDSQKTMPLNLGASGEALSPLKQSLERRSENSLRESSSQSTPGQSAFATSSQARELKVLESPVSENGAIRNSHDQRMFMSQNNVSTPRGKLSRFEEISS